MSVIINDFEILPEQEEAPAPQTNGEARESSPQASPIRPLDLEEILRRHYFRKMRLRAH